MKAVFDTNILIDYLNGIDAAFREFSRYQSRIISIITYIEVLVGATDPHEVKQVRGFLDSFQIRDVSRAVADESVALRQNHRLKIPDAIVYATARAEGCLLVSRNIKDIKADWPDVRVPYEL